MTRLLRRSWTVSYTHLDVYKRQVLDSLRTELEAMELGPLFGLWLQSVSYTHLNIIKNLIMDCQSYTKYRPNETTGVIFVSWRRDVYKRQVLL